MNDTKQLEKGGGGERESKNGRCGQLWKLSHGCLGCIMLFYLL